MRLIIDIGHPAHVHLFKNLAWNLMKKGHKVLFTCRDREHVIHLLKTYGFVYENYGRHYKSLKGKIFGLAKNELQMLDTALRFKPDMFISHGSTIAAHISFLVRKPHIALEDTFNMEQVRLSMPFTDVVLTGDYEHPSLGKKEIKYPGYHELAYLHPNVFTPDESVLKSLGVENGEKYAIVRFVAWAATHDMGQTGLSLDQKMKLVDLLSDYVKIFISSEEELPADLSKYQIRIQPEEMHDALAFAQIYVGESPTMAEEAAVLGVPSVLVSSWAGETGVIRDLTKYNLVRCFHPSEINQTYILINQYLQNPELKEIHSSFRDHMLNDKIDVTTFIVWFIEEYPNSIEKTRKQGSTFYET